MKNPPRTIRTSLIVLALLLLAPCQYINAQSQPAAARQANSVVTIRFRSALVQKDLPYNVVLPAGYSKPANKKVRYPVLYLLHGLFGHYSDWTSRTKLAQYATDHRLLVVTPEGNDAWYTDSAVVPTEKYETYIVKELIPEVQRRFRVLESRGGRAIAGLSMGGYGALKFAVKYPELFAFAASMSGVLDAASLTTDDLKNMNTISRSLAVVFGPSDSSIRQSNDLQKLYRELPSEKLKALPYLYLDCGIEDPFLSSTRALSDLLIQRKVPHEARILPGAHNWNYWDQQVIEVLQLTERRVDGPR